MPKWVWANAQMGLGEHVFLTETTSKVVWAFYPDPLDEGAGQMPKGLWAFVLWVSMLYKQWVVFTKNKLYILILLYIQLIN